MIEIETERFTLKNLGNADNDHYLNNGAVGPQNLTSERQ